MRFVLGASVLVSAGCVDRVIVDQDGAGAETDTDADASSTSEGDEGSEGSEVGTGCVPGEPGCPCPPGQVPRDGMCVVPAVETMEAIVATDQSALAGDVIPQPPAVRVSAGGEPVAGVTVSFGTAGTVGGALGQVQAVTDANGIATADSWTLGKLDGTYFVRAAIPTEPDVEPVDFTGRTISDFEIVLHYINEPTDSQFAAFEFSRLRWQAALTNSLPPISDQLSNVAAECGVGFAGGPVTIPGVHIFVELAEIDGPGGDNGNILGQAGPCSLRDDGSPYAGIMRFDTFDLDELEQSGSLETVILHEMGHVLGVGSLWGFSGLLEEPSLPDNAGVDTHFTGVRATQIFQELLNGTGQAFQGNIVPVENNAQFGSSDSHWRETTVDDELMSPRLGGAGEVAPMSALTIGSMGDLGFFVPNELAADAWTLPPQSLVEPSETSGARGTDTVLRPLWVRASDGSVSPL